jgi:Rrf2 family transcriptional regulator, cysteine metabolism repressor
MKFSTRTTYGLRAMINLGKHYQEGSISLTTIAQEEKISLKYLERLFAILKNADLVGSQKGMSGGYQLKKSPKKINVYEIIKILEGEINPFYCLDSKGKIYCNKKCACGANMVLKKVQEAIINTLKSIKLSDLL